MKRSLSWVATAALSAWLIAAPAFAQSGSPKTMPAKAKPVVINAKIAGAVKKPLPGKLPVAKTLPAGKRLPGKGPASAGPQPEPPTVPTDLSRATRINFDTLPTRAATSGGQTLRNEYRSAGVSFPSGISIVKGGGNEFAQARSGANAAAALPAGEFANQALKIDLASPQKTVTMYVALLHGLGGEAVATLKAMDDAGRTVARNTANFRGDGRTWAKLEVTSSSANIRQVVLTGGSAEFPNTNFLAIDDLWFSGGTAAATPAAADRHAPVISILSPVANTSTRERFVQARVRITEDQFLSEVTYRLVRDGSTSNERWLPLAGGVNSPAPDKLLERTWDLELGQGSGQNATGFGWYTLTVRAKDVAGNQAERSVRLQLTPPPQADVWVLGLEYNQGVQDVVHTDLNRGPAAGSVPLGHPSGRDSTLAWPITPGKPMVVRAYVGLRGTPTPPPRGIPVTGRLRIEAPETGGPGRTIRPLNSDDCFNHLGTAMPSRDPVMAFPTLGTQGFRTQSPYCIDLIAARTHWEGTLNFVVPAEFTERLTRGAELRVTVEPVGFVDSSPADNTFELSLQNVAPRETAKIRLVRLAPGRVERAPTRAEAERVIRDMTQFTRYPQVEIVSDEELRYEPGTLTIRGELAGIKVIEEELDEYNSLWLMLAQRYGLKKDETLLALLPRMPGRRYERTGVGWRIPKLEAFRGATGRGGIQPDYLGGVAWALMPSQTPGSRIYWDEVSTVAHEFYHAHLDAR